MVTNFKTIGELNIIETPADKIYTQRITKPLHSIGANGINGTLYDSNGSVMILINNGVVLGNNAFWNGWNAPPRPVIYYDGNLKCEIVKSLNDLTTPVNKIHWAVGGGSLPYLASEKFGADVTRVAERTGLAIKGDRVYLIATKSKMSLEYFGNRIKETIDPDYSIFLDGGGSTQMFYGKSIIKSTRSVDNGIFIKE